MCGEVGGRKCGSLWMETTALSAYREGRRLILCDLIHDKGLLSTPIVALDIGARNAFVDTRWIALPPNMVRLHGFEPDPQECDALNQRADAEGLDFHFHPIALAERTGPTDFYRYAEQAANSFYPPNRSLVERFCYGRELPLSSQFELVEKRVIDTKSMVDWAHDAGVTDIDFCKLNVQGAELDILRGAGPLLDPVLGIVAEQTFNATYIGAPLFGEVYEFLRAAGFSMFDVVGTNLVARTRSPIHVTDDHVFSVRGIWPRHQLLEGHFFYLRDPILSAGNWSSGSASPSLQQCIKLACIAEVFGQIEFAFELLSWIAASPGTGKPGLLSREVAERGAEIYLSVSQPDAPSADEVSPGDSLDRENKRLTARLAAQSSQVARLEAGLEAWATEAARLRTELAASEVTRLQTELAAQSSQIARLEAGLAAWTSEATRLRGELAAYKGYAISGWRMTAPLRRARGLLYGTLKKLGGGRH
jgi:FkbM family methyltransferase